MSASLPSAAGRNDPCPCGSGKKFKKCCMEPGKPAAPAFARGARETALLQNAERAYAAHRLDEAAAFAAQALKADERDAYAMHLLANVYFHQKNYAGAEEWIRKCVAADEASGLYYFTYGVILSGQGKVDEALAMTRKALALSPPNLLHSIYTNMGTYLHEKREIAAAIECYDKALAAKPDFAPAFFRRGVAYFTRMDTHKARMQDDFNRAIALDPGNAAMFRHIATLYLEINDFVQAIAVLRHAVTLQPDFEDGWVLLAHAFYRIGDISTALSLYGQLAQKYPHNPAVKLESALMFPAVPQSNEDITSWRDRFFAESRKLMQENFRVDYPEQCLLTLPFYQAYHGRDNLALAKQLAELLLSACPALAFTAAHCQRGSAKKSTLRIGFVSGLFHSYVLSQFYGPLLEALAQDARFEVVLMANSALTNVRVESLAASVRYVMLPTRLAEAQRAVAAQEIDVLVYLDIGMNVMNYLLAFARLAPLQMVMGGHPVTTGIPAMDYFITSKQAEPENGKEHYSEKLLLLEKNTVVFRRREMPAAWKTRAQLGLPGEETRLYACPVTLFKLHPDMDRLFAALLARDAQAMIILFDSEYKMLWRASLEKRFAAAMPAAHAARIRFVPYAAGDDFFHMMRAMDCVLDTLHFSFGTTAFLMLNADVPFVTLPDEFLRGRAGAMLYRQMDMHELIAESPEQYVELALKLAQDKAFHARMQEAIRARSHRLFNDTSVIAPFVEALRDLHYAL